MKARVVAKGWAKYMALHTCKGKDLILLGGSAPRPPPPLVGRCRSLRRPGLHVASLWSAAVAAPKGHGLVMDWPWLRHEGLLVMILPTPPCHAGQGQMLAWQRVCVMSGPP